MLAAKYNNIGLDNEGYLLDPSQWDCDLAQALADDINITMTDEHWYVVNFVRNHFEYHQAVPEMRILMKQMKIDYGAEKASRKFIFNLFPYGYASQACKIAGMRKPLKLMLDL